MNRKRVREITIELLTLAEVPKEEIEKLTVLLDQHGDLDAGLSLVSSAAAVVARMLDSDAASRCLNEAMRVLIDAELKQPEKLDAQRTQSRLS